VRSFRSFVGVSIVALFLAAPVAPVVSAGPVALAAQGHQAAEDALTSMQAAIACAVTPTLALPATDVLRIAGVQDTALRLLYGSHDLIIIDGGSSRDVQVGQRFFVRRLDWFGPYGGRQDHTVRTAAWIRIVAVNETTSIAAIEHSCTGAMSGDFLEPFAAPIVPDNVNRVDTSGELDFKSVGRVGFGERLRTTAGIGDFMLIDRGADQGTEVGSRFAVYRDLRATGLPLAAIGEAVVVNAGPSLSVVHIVSAHDSVVRGDYVVPRR
jgi:hypothetical protein